MSDDDEAALVWLYRQGGMSGAWYEVTPPFEGLDADDLVVGLWRNGEWRERTVARAREITA